MLADRTDWYASVPSTLQIRNIVPEDRALYRCRVDFKISPTMNQKILLVVIGKYHIITLFGDFHIVNLKRMILSFPSPLDVVRAHEGSALYYLQGRIENREFIDQI